MAHFFTAKYSISVDSSNTPVRLLFLCDNYVRDTFSTVIMTSMFNYFGVLKKSNVLLLIER